MALVVGNFMGSLNSCTLGKERAKFPIQEVEYLASKGRSQILKEKLANESVETIILRDFPHTILRGLSMFLVCTELGLLSLTLFFFLFFFFEFQMYKAV